MGRLTLLYKARILRYLSTNYVFKEVSPDVFAHNLVSSCLDTGKSFEEISKEYVIFTKLRFSIELELTNIR